MTRLRRWLRSVDPPKAREWPMELVPFVDRIEACHQLRPVERAQLVELLLLVASAVSTLEQRPPEADPHTWAAGAWELVERQARILLEAARS